jgi:putative pyruvate formate lyase activating enzyme
MSCRRICGWAPTLAARARQALALPGQERCGVCPRLCKVNRLADHKGLCAISRQAVVASCFPHFGEENSLRAGTAPGRSSSPAATRCVFCQNHDISWQVHGERVTPARLAQMMLTLQARGLWVPEISARSLTCCFVSRRPPGMIRWWC